MLKCLKVAALIFVFSVLAFTQYLDPAKQLSVVVASAISDTKNVAAIKVGFFLNLSFGNAKQAKVLLELSLLHMGAWLVHASS